MNKEQSELWERLMTSWEEEGPACFVAAAQRYLGKHPSDFAGWIVLADGLSALARFAEAREALRKAWQLSPPETRDHVCHQLGTLYDKQDLPRRAERWYRRAAKTNPNTEHLIFLGSCLARQGRFAEAKHCHRQAIALHSSPLDEAYFNLGLILRAKENYDEALHCFEQAIAIDPDYEKAKDARDDLLKYFQLSSKN
jgi:tetratricopeptide (TPR) repeat protein